MKSNKKQLDPNLENIIKEQDEVETYEKQKKNMGCNCIERR